MASITIQKVVIGSTKNGEPLKLIDQETGEEVTLKNIQRDSWKLVRETSLGGGHITTVDSGMTIKTPVTPYCVILVFEKSIGL